MASKKNNSDFSHLTDSQLENLIKQPTITTEERAKIGEELTKRIKDQLLQSAQAQPTQLQEKQNEPAQIITNESKTVSSTPNPAKGNSTGIGFLWIIVIIIIIGIFVAISSRNRTTVATGNRCWTGLGLCDIDSSPLQSRCSCYNPSTGLTEVGEVVP